RPCCWVDNQSRRAGKMNIIFTTLKKILFWCYDRGTWQYDLLCVLILAFIFLAPNWVFNTSGRSTPDQPLPTHQVIKAASQPASSPELIGEQETPPPDKQPETPAGRRQD